MYIYICVYIYIYIHTYRYIARGKVYTSYHIIQYGLEAYIISYHIIKAYTETCMA